MSKQPKPNFFRTKGFFLLVALVAFILVLTFFFGDSGIMEIIKVQTQIDTLSADIEALEKEKEKLQEEIKELESNPLSLERKAREELWLMKKNEKVIVIIKDQDKKEQPGRPGVKDKQKPAG